MGDRVVIDWYGTKVYLDTPLRLDQEQGDYSFNLSAHLAGSSHRGRIEGWSSLQGTVTPGPGVNTVHDLHRVLMSVFEKLDSIPDGVSPVYMNISVVPNKL